jgi:hypothetical protein
LGIGSTYSGTAGSWQTTTFYSATGATSVVGTNGATFYITGVQLEKGSTATSFDYRPYGTELSLCQRYFYMLCNGANQTIPTGSYYATTLIATTIQLPVEMRTNPTLYQVSGTDYFRIFVNNGSDYFNAFTSLSRPSPRCVCLDAEGGGVSGTIGFSGPLESSNSATRLGFLAEL